MAGMLWVSDREPGVRQLFAELLPDADVLEPDDLHARLALGQRPDALVIDGTQLLDLPLRQRSTVLDLPRVLVCTGIMLSSLPIDLVSGPGVAVLAKPFCVEDLEAAVEWLRGTPGAPMPPSLPFATLVQRRRPRRPGSRLPAR